MPSPYKSSSFIYWSIKQDLEQLLKDSCYNKLLLSHNIISTNCLRSFSAIIMEPSRCMCTITGNGIINTEKKSFYCFSDNLEVIQLNKWISKCLISALPLSSIEDYFHGHIKDRSQRKKHQAHCCFKIKKTPDIKQHRYVFSSWNVVY